MKRTGMVYMHTGPTGKVYIGKTWQPAKERFSGDWSKTYSSKPFIADYRRYGKAAFTTTIIFSIDSENPIEDDAMLAQLEIDMIQFMGTIHPAGYNVHRGGGGGAPRTAEVAARFRGEGNPMYGREHSEETREMMSDGRRRENLPEDVRAAMREAQKNRPRDAHGHYIPLGNGPSEYTIKRRAREASRKFS